MSSALQLIKRSSFDMADVATIIMAGGRGARLMPLTHQCCKPALCFGGHFCLIDFPISNALNSGCREIYILTQYLSHTLHNHLLSTCTQNHLDNATIQMMPAEEKSSDAISKASWFQGTADAIRHHKEYFENLSNEYFLILSGDQIYHMDFFPMVQQAKKNWR